MKFVIVHVLLIFSTALAAQPCFNINDYGAVGDGKVNNAAAIQKAIDAASATGGRVLVPTGGVYLTGPFQLQSNITLEIAANAKLLASPDESLYTKSAFKQNRGEGMMWIEGNNIKNVTICGAGTIDGNGIAFMGPEEEEAYVLKPVTTFDPRPHVLTIIGGVNIRILQLHICNSAYWTVHLIGCNDVAIDNITLLNSLKVRNSDGIDIDHSKNVRISNCYIESGDDCICLKNRREYAEFGVCENIVVTNCTMSSSSCAIKIGSENMDSIRRVLINNCIISRSNRGIGIQNRDEGTVTDVVFSNILIESHLFSDVWWGKSEPVYVTAYARAASNHKDAGWRFPPGATVGKVGVVSSIYFTNIKCKGENGVYVGADSKDKIVNIVFDQVDLQIDKTTAVAGGVYDRRPARVNGLLQGRTSGFYIDNGTDIAIRNSSVAWGKNKPAYFAHVVESHDVKELSLSNIAGTAASANYTAIQKY